MALLAQTTDMSKSAILRFPISLEDAIDLLPPNTSGCDRPTAETFAEAPVVLVEETPAPTGLAFGEELAQDAVDDAGTWRQQWTVVPLALGAAKAQLVGMARDLLRAKMAARELSAAEILAMMELRDYEVGHTANVPILTAVWARRGGSAAQTATYVRGLLDLAANRAAQLIPTYFDVIDRIQAATTVAEAKLIYDELEALS